MPDKKDKNTQKTTQMTIYDYEEKYVRRQNSRGARLALFVAAGIVGVFLVWCLLSIRRLRCRRGRGGAVRVHIHSAGG